MRIWKPLHDPMTGPPAGQATRAVLVLTGLGFGLVSAAGYADDPVRTLLAILIGFGAVHAPAAVILFVKQARGAGRS